ncbi:MAG: hypothetical protein M3209_04640 [Acidobacteriota bacterium]|nr:hypothetical protein [Acidobacteriota bacterium]
MKKHVLICVALGLLCLVHTNFAQNAAIETQTQTQNEEEVSRFEVGAHYTALGNGYDNGIGGRLSFNVNRNLAIESEVNFFPFGRFRGNATQALFGVKAGKRWSKFGIFGKARPGFIYDSKGKAEPDTSSNDIYRLRFRGTTNFTADVGGVVEFYPTKKLTTRFDFGDTITRVRSQNGFFVDANNNLGSFRIPATTRHSFQFSAGIGFRF